MTVRDKILEALGDIDNISDERLCDLLLDAFNAQRKQIERLGVENSAERIALHNEREQLRQEMHKMRSDPLYGAAGQYFFNVNRRYFHVTIEGTHIHMCESMKQASSVWVDYLGYQMTREAWLSK